MSAHIVVASLCLGAAAIAAAWSLARLRTELPPEPASARPHAPRAKDPLARTERIISTSAWTAAEFHMRLRPVLRDIAQERLERRGVQLDGEPGRARDVLGDQAWQLLRADRPPPDPPLSPGPSLAEIEEVLERLEAV
jgi:hypothetical protein